MVTVPTGSRPGVCEPFGSLAPCGNNIASLCHELRLGPGDEKTIIFMLGVTQQTERVPEVVARFSNLENVDASLAALRADWDEYLGKLSVKQGHLNYTFIKK